MGTAEKLPDPDDEKQVIRDLWDQFPKLSDEELLLVKEIALWKARWLRTERRPTRARRFLWLAKAARNECAARCPIDEQINEDAESCDDLDS